MIAAIIGLGIGEKHLETLNKINFISKVKIYDLNFIKTKEIEKKYKKAIACKNIKEIYDDKDIKLACIASYDSSHFIQIKNFLKKNVNVFVEKPAVTKLHEAKKIFQLLKKKELFFGTNYILRKSKRFIDLKNRISRNYLGKIYSIEADYNYGRLSKLTKGWRGDERKYSITLGGGIHLIDLIYFLTNNLPIFAFSEKNKIVTKNTKFKNYDFVTSILKFKNNTILKLSSNFGCVYPHFHKLNIYGTKRTYENHYEYGKIYYKRDSKKFIKIKTPYKNYNKGALLKEFVIDLKKNQNRKKYLKNIFNTLSVCFAIEESLRKNKKINIKYIK